MLAKSPECKLRWSGKQALTRWQHYFPPILPTTSKPDIVIGDHSYESIIVEELTTPFVVHTCQAIT